MSEMMKIGVDLDDVVSQFTDPFLKFNEKLTGIRIAYEEVKSYKLWETFGCTRDEAVRRVVEFYQTDDFDALMPEMGAIEAVNRLAAAHEVTFITARYGPAIDKTDAWLAKHCPKIDAKVIYSGHHQCSRGRRKSKADICLEEGIYCMIEDNGDNALECAEKGITAYLISRPWNTEYKHPRITRVADWNEIISSISPAESINNADGSH